MNNITIEEEERNYAIAERFVKKLVKEFQDMQQDMIYLCEFPQVRDILKSESKSDTSMEIDVEDILETNIGSEDYDNDDSVSS